MPALQKISTSDPMPLYRYTFPILTVKKIKEAETLNKLYVQIFSEQDNFSVTVPVEQVVEDGEFFRSLDESSGNAA